MNRSEFRAMIEPLVVALGASFDLPTWTVYYRALEDVSAPLLAAAVERAAKSARFMPKPGELRQYAEDARTALMAAHPYEGCCECEGQIGWRPRLDQPRAVERCPCWGRHQERLAQLGVGWAPLALPAETREAAG